MLRVIPLRKVDAWHQVRPGEVRADCGGLQSDRDELAGVNYDMLVAARQGLESLYKRGGFELAHVSGKTPKVPDQLVEQLGQTVKLFRQPAVEPRSLKVAGFSVDFGVVADTLESGAAELQLPASETSTAS